MAGRLTTHVLDTAQGRPAPNMSIELWRLDAEGSGRRMLKTVRTNGDGRTDTPLLVDDELAAGVYELVFAVGQYFIAQGIATASPPFLYQVPIRFGIADPVSHSNAPLRGHPSPHITIRRS